MSDIGCSVRSLIYDSGKLIFARSLPRTIESIQQKKFLPDHFMNDMTLVPSDIVEQIDNPTRALELLHAPVKNRRIRKLVMHQSKKEE